jgi:hypothetical protein
MISRKKQTKKMNRKNRNKGKREYTIPVQTYKLTDQESNLVLSIPARYVGSALFSTNITTKIISAKGEQSLFEDYKF